MRRNLTDRFFHDQADARQILFLHQRGKSIENFVRRRLDGRRGGGARPL
ncbi:MAG TPA: hypothetical protein VFQ57_07540 [Sphingomonas sp.]|nr:hypothetical protein [Sphingomonas sp.]